MIVIFALVFLKFELGHSHLIDLGEVSSSSLGDLDIVSVVAGGDRSSLRRHPYNVKLMTCGSDSCELCGGIILTAKHVLTAAHCFGTHKDVKDMKVIANSESTFSPEAMYHNVWHYEIHENYSIGVQYANDIAVIIIHDQFKFGDKVKRAILVNHGEWMTEDEKNFTVSGWGDTENLGESNYQILREASLRYISQENCSRMGQLKLTPDMFCLFGDGKTDSGRGDSGGGVLWNDQIVGIISHGQDIQKPGAYANVFYLLPWIRKTTVTLLSKFCDYHRTTSNYHYGKKARVVKKYKSRVHVL